uniref:Uncharacterized protein n=1 Tax=Alexandrium andersonii TaxID=327968 RepID=A0A7S2NEC5_9DINO
MVWVLGILWLAFATFFVLLFLANLSVGDGDSYAISTGMSLVQEILLLPLFLAMFRPVLVVLTLFILARARGTSKEEVLMQQYEKHMAEERDEEAPDEPTEDKAAGLVAPLGWLAPEDEPDQTESAYKAYSHRTVT